MPPPVSGHKKDMAAIEGDSPQPRDDQQARLVESLRAAGGAPVDFEQLRAMGIEHPAVVSYELEAAGVPIVQTRASNRRALALEEQRLEGPVDTSGATSGGPSGGPAVSQMRANVWLEPLLALLGRAWGAGEGAGRAVHAARSAGPFAAARRSGGGAWPHVPPAWLSAARAAGERVRARARTAVPTGRVRGAMSAPPLRATMLAAASLAGVALLAGVAVAVFGHNASTPAVGPTAHIRAKPHLGSHRSAAPTVRRAAGAPPPAVAQVPAAIGVAGTPAASGRANAEALQLEGHQLLGDGRYTAAIGDLEGAIRASGQSLGHCAEPTSEACLTFAYALYDLGRALRLDGDRGAAVSILSERLHIDNQRGVVERELELARAGNA
jgi:tetratricopeptide (TPR) repeat protein